jgi:hypothetical protein
VETADRGAPVLAVVVVSTWRGPSIARFSNSRIPTDANDGVVSTASLVIGVAAGRATRSEVLLAGIAGMAAGALSMAAGEYVSVSSQADTERADVELEDRRAVQPPSRPCRPRRGDRLSSWQGCWGR